MGVAHLLVEAGLHQAAHPIRRAAPGASLEVVKAAAAAARLAIVALVVKGEQTIKQLAHAALVAVAVVAQAASLTWRVVPLFMQAVAAVAVSACMARVHQALAVRKALLRQVRAAAAAQVAPQAVNKKLVGMAVMAARMAAVVAVNVEALAALALFASSGLVVHAAHPRSHRLTSDLNLGA